jgi:hypothetical protein
MFLDGAGPAGMRLGTEDQSHVAGCATDYPTLIRSMDEFKENLISVYAGVRCGETTLRHPRY